MQSQVKHDSDVVVAESESLDEIIDKYSDEAEDDESTADAED
jgi:hypothetical protein